jgi:hypothetical protein
MAGTKEPVHLTAEEVSARWCGRIKAVTLKNWRAAGVGPPYVKAGGAVLYPTKSLAAWEKENTIHAADKSPKD